MKPYYLHTHTHTHTLIKVLPLINSTIIIISVQSVRYESLAKRNPIWNCAVTVDLTQADSIQIFCSLLHSRISVNLSAPELYRKIKSSYPNLCQLANIRHKSYLPLKVYMLLMKTQGILLTMRDYVVVRDSIVTYRALWLAAKTTPNNRRPD